MFSWAVFTIVSFLTCDVFTRTEDAFDQFLKVHGKDYNPASAEYLKRKSIFMDSLQRIAWLNGNRTHKDAALYGITEFSDLTPQEFHDLVIKRWDPVHHPKKHRQKREATDFKNIPGIPQKLDWRDKGIIGDIRNQDKCGACWAFSTVATIESMLAMKTGKLEKLSVQQMIDCSTETKGCDGGDTCAVLDWLSENNVPVVTEKEYPFKDETDGVCKMKPKTGIRINNNHTCDNFTGEELDLVKLIATHGPVTAAVDASGWQDYLGGIIQYNCATRRNHAVQLIGYDLTGDIPFYIIRNSWGTRFGVDGYLYVAIGNNLCAISEEISALSVKVESNHESNHI